MWLFAEDRFRRPRPPWVWRAWERARELWEIERTLRPRREKVAGLVVMAEVLAFVHGLRPETWHWNAVAWAAIDEEVACRARLRSARHEYRALKAEGLRRAASNAHTERMIRAVFPFWFEQTRAGT